MLQPLSLGLLVLCASLMSPLLRADSLIAFAQLMNSQDHFQADFEQNTYAESGARLSQVKGRLTLQRPSQFHWLSYAPQEQAVISNGSLLWVYDIDLEQVTIQSAAESLKDSPAVILSGNAAEIAQRYSVIQEPSSSDGLARFSLSPMAPDATLRAMQFTFIDKDLTQLVLNDSLGQTTVITLSQHQYEANWPADLFEFVAPAGVDILDQRQ